MTEKQGGNIRIKDVAKLAGVSVGTVDRVIHRRGEVSPETRKKVLKVIRELNFSPNLIASSLATSKRNKTAVLIPEANKENLFWEDHLKGIKRAGIELAPYGQVIDIAKEKKNNEDSQKHLKMKMRRKKTKENINSKGQKSLDNFFNP